MCDKNFRNISGSSCDLTVSDKRRRVGIHFTLKQQMGLGVFFEIGNRTRKRNHVSPWVL